MPIIERLICFAPIRVHTTIIYMQYIIQYILQYILQYIIQFILQYIRILINNIGKKGYQNHTLSYRSS